MVSDRKPRGYRYVILAAVGWLILAAAPGPESNNASHNTATDQQIAETLNAISTTLSNSLKPAEKDAGCPEGSDYRESDLCAQWKAAIAASDAAKWSLWTVLLSAASVGFLVWTFMETRSTSRQELRAYVFPFTLYTVPRNPNSKDPKLMIQVGWKNYGATPTDRLTYTQEIILRDVYSDEFSGFSENSKSYSYTLPPNDGFRTHEEFISKPDAEAVFHGRKFLFIAGEARYRDVFSRTHVTRHFWNIGLLRDPKGPQIGLNFSENRWTVVGEFNCADGQCEGP
jgi:hypothetical protein